MKTLRMMFNNGVSTRLRTAIVLLGGSGILLAAMAVLPLSANAQGSRYQLTVRNRSSYQIDRLHLSSTELTNWGTDHLGQRVIPANSDFTLTNIKPGEYDIKFVDHDGDSCVIRRVNIFENKDWTLTDEYLLRCEGY